MFYSTILVFLNAHDDVDYWCRWGGTTASNNVYIMLKMLPISYKDTSTLLKLFDLLTINWSGYEALFRDNKYLVQQCWSLPFVRNLAEDDYAINYFLESYWSGSGYYFSFYKNEDGQTSSSFNLPWVSKPYGTKYYDIEDMIYYWDDANNNHLTKVFRIEIVDYNIINVFCYQNNRTYTLYR